MTKHKKILICCVLAALLTILTIIPAFAVNYESLYKFVGKPSDAGEVITNLNTLIDGRIHKIYMCIELSERPSYPAYKIDIKYLNSYDNTTTSTSSYYLQDLSNVINWGFSLDTGIYAFCYTASFNTTGNYPIPLKLWIPVYLYNATIENYNEYSNITYYTSTLSNQEIYQEGFSIGYNNGYNEGLLAGQNIQQYTNLVGYVEQLIGQFTGSAAAQYITPIAIVLVVLFVYFLFIRFLLSLIKAKGIIKTCDIIMIVACIIMLVVMYAPMLDLTIKTEQINSSEETTEAVQINRSNIYVESTETGDIYHGPVGTAIVTKSETIEDIYKISEDIETESIAYEKD